MSNILRSISKHIFNAAVVFPASRSSLIRYALAYAVEQTCPRLPGHSYYDKMAAYDRLKELFLNGGDKSPYGRPIRSEIIDRFETVDREIDVQTTAMDALFLAEALLSLECNGDVVECGCFNGGSTAKLSIIAHITGRRLFVFDSFEGLPEMDANDSHDLHMRRSARIKRDWISGEYAAPIEQVKANVEKYGEIGVCTFTKGWFSETLRNLPREIAFAFTDVDVPLSAKDCLTHIWPKLSAGGVFFSHDIAYIKVMQNFLDENLWTQVLQEHPPIFWGAGYGMGDGSPHLGFAVKGSVTAEYIKNLTPYR